ncbi:PH domain-containing protein [Mycolicibacterium sp.]|uniref:PH domain-containing protein n=1 Tax=Mycolicibacterium sp. TaxID=2320850 RepID=UPI0025E18082|nr:PH domain-containing protein [Mycolicibacterium sp.]
MTPSPGKTDQWDAVIRPRLMPRLAIAGAVLMVLAGIGVAWTLLDDSTGPALRSADQWAMLLLAVVLAGVILLLTRPRLRIGPAGLGVRNVLEERVIPWNQVVGISFPKRWARVELPGYEYVPVVAVQSVDRDRAVAAMDTLREAMDRYSG